MLCPNCGSNEVIAIQGENYCINCGQLVPKVASPAELSTDGLPAGVKILPVPSTAPAPAKRAKRGRPKAGPLDAPAAVTATLPEPESASEPAPKIINHSPGREVHDITPPKLKRPDQPLPAAVEAATLAYGAVLKASLGGRWTARRGLFAASPVALLVMVLTVAGLVLASSKPGRLLAATQAAGWSVYGELIIVAIIYYLLRSLTHAAIIVGTGRLADHRPLATNRWLELAADSQGRRLGLDSLIVLALAAVGALSGWLVVGGGHTWPVPEWLQAAGLMVGFASLLYLLLAFVMTVSLAHVAVTLVQVDLTSGLALGWRLFRHHFELAGARLLALVVELLALCVLAVGAAGWLAVTVPAMRPVVVLALAAVLVVAGALAGAGSAIWWTLAYRLLVQVDHPAGFHKLLATHVPKAPRRGPVVAVSTTLLILAGAAAAWPWLVN